MMWLLAMVAWVQAAELGEVLVFSGRGHARLLLTFEEGLPRATTESRGSEGGLSPRGFVRLENCDPGEGGARVIEVAKSGVTALEITPRGPDVEITAHLQNPRRIHTMALRDIALVVDLMEPDAVPDPDLPSADQLLRWVDGVSLVRAAGGRPSSRRLVVVDAGHGGHDHGALGLTGTREADVALEIARRVAHGLESRLDIDVVMTRDTDVFIPLGERAAIANRHDADLFLSIHANAASGPTAWGIETYSLDTASDAGAARVAARENAIRSEADEPMDPLFSTLLVAGTTQLARELAGEVQRGCVDHLQSIYGKDQIRDLGSKTALFHVLVSTRMPAILYEAHFLTNPADERRLRTPHFQGATADALVDAVGRWLARRPTDG